MEHATHHPSGAQNLQEAPRFLENWCPWHRLCQPAHLSIC